MDKKQRSLFSYIIIARSMVILGRNHHQCKYQSWGSSVPRSNNFPAIHSLHVSNIPILSNHLELSDKRIPFCIYLSICRLFRPAGSKVSTPHFNSRNCSHSIGLACAESPIFASTYSGEPACLDICRTDTEYFTESMRGKRYRWKVACLTWLRRSEVHPFAQSAACTASIPFQGSSCWRGSLLRLQRRDREGTGRTDTQRQRYLSASGRSKTHYV